jgi:hypothetical protein
MSRTARLLLLATPVLAAALLGFYAAAALAPERLHQQVESWLEKATHAEAEITSLRLIFGFPIRLEGSGLRLYDGSLTVERASARIDVVSLLLRRPRLTRLRLDGAHLKVQRSPRGVWDPPIFRKSAQDREEPALAPLRAIEGATRFLLTRPVLADTLVVRRSRVSLIHQAPSGSGEPVRVAFENVAGRLLHSRLFGDARLFLRVDLVQAGEERGRLEWNGSRDDQGVMQVTMAANGLDLSTLATYLRGVRPEASLGGTLEGVVDFTTAEPGVGQLDLDLAARDLETSLAAGGSDASSEPLRLPSASLRMRVDLDQERVVLSKARIGTGALDFSLDARIARPLRDTSRSRVTVALTDLAMEPETAKKLAGWLPASPREHFESLAGRVRSGRLVRAELKGSATLRRWREVLTGDLDHLPAGFRFGLEIEDVAIDVDDANRFERLNARMAFENDKLDVFGATGDLNGGPLPVLELSFEGLSKLLAAPKRERGMASSAEALVGLTPLFEFLSREPDAAPRRAASPNVLLTFEHVYHPALLWPLNDVQVQLTVQSGADGLHLDLLKCAWAGVSLDGVVDWRLRPNRQVSIDLVAVDPPPESPAEEPAAPPPPAVPEPPRDGEHPWVLGHFEVGEMDSPRWSQRLGRGRFSATGGVLSLHEVEIELEPAGLLKGSADLDLTRRRSVPYTAELALEGGDVKTLIAQRGAEGEVATGVLGARAAFGGSLIPGRPLLHDANGEARLEAEEGAIQRSVPPVLALALASRSLNPFSRRDELRYRRGTAELELVDGEMRTNAIEIDGPDIRLFASGTLDLSESPHTMDAEVVLFLFRQVDRALELIPILNVLLLGENENLVAAYFQLVGTWEKPEARAKPLRTLEEGPGDVLTKGIPRVVKRGIDAIGNLFRGDRGGEDAGSAAPEESDVPPAEASSS